MTIGRSVSWWLFAIVVLAIPLLGTWRWYKLRAFRAEIAAVEAEMAAGRRGAAARRLNTLLASGSDTDRVAFLLGMCERARGRLADADAAWAQVTPGSASSARAIEARVLLRVDSGRFRAAEELVEESGADSRNDATALRILLVPTLMLEGRFDDARGLIEGRLRELERIGEGASHTAIVLARLSYGLESMLEPPQTIRAKLDRAGRLAPDDDRVWLGRANLATRSGDLVSAGKWLDACEKAHPDDNSVRKARLQYALAKGDLAQVRSAIAQMPADAVSQTEAQRALSWVARRDNNLTDEQSALQKVVAERPSDLGVLDRLSEIAATKSDSDRSTQWKQRRAAIELTMARYKELFERNQPIRDSTEMGLLAEKLGRIAEARVYLEVAAAHGLHRDQARRELERLSHAVLNPNAPTAHLKDRLAPDFAGPHERQTTAPAPNQ
jgi:thioredoxin-like negative regulator of GroEL